MINTAENTNIIRIGSAPVKVENKAPIPIAWPLTQAIIIDEVKMATRLRVIRSRTIKSFIISANVLYVNFAANPANTRANMILAPCSPITKGILAIPISYPLDE